MVRNKFRIQVYALILVTAGSFAIPQQSHADLFQMFKGVGRMAVDVVRKTFQNYTAPVKQAGKSAKGLTNVLRRAVNTPKHVAKKRQAQFRARIKDQAKATKKALEKQVELVRRNSDNDTVQKNFEKQQRKAEKQYQKSLADSEKMARASQSQADKIVSRDRDYYTKRATRNAPPSSKNYHAQAERAAKRNDATVERDYARFQKSIARETRKRERAIRAYEKSARTGYSVPR